MSDTPNLKLMADTIRDIADRVEAGKFDHWRLEHMCSEMTPVEGATVADIEAGSVEWVAKDYVVAVELPMSALDGR